MSRGSMRTVKGIVVKNSSLKTLMIQVETRSKNKKYDIVSILKKKFPVHDEKMLAKVGDIIEAVETKPISKTKRWYLIKVIEKGVDQWFNQRLN